jgi:hypothetical protein
MDNVLILQGIFGAGLFLMVVLSQYGQVLEEVCVISRKHGLFLGGCYNR